MRLHVDTRRARATRALQARVRLRLACALARFAGLLVEARATLADAGGPDGRACRLLVRARDGWRLELDERAPDHEQAAQLAIDRAGRAVALHFGRGVAR